MSRLATLSPEALAALFDVEPTGGLVALLTFSGANITVPARICTQPVTRIYSDDDTVVYGLVSRGNDYPFFPVTVTLPDDGEGGRRSQLSIVDVSRELVPLLRNLTGAPNVRIEMVHRDAPDTVEIDFGDMLFGAVEYEGDTVSGALSDVPLDREPFPCFTFTPSVAPGMF